MSVLASYWTIEGESEGQYSQLRSKFIAFAIHIESEEEALRQVARIRQKYYDARHVCWAYRIGADGETTRSNDDGEPSGTAGKPILGQLLSHNLTEVVVIVVRYFGGVKLGTPGLIESYRAAAHEALEAGQRVERVIERQFSVRFGYELMGEVMRYIKDSGAKVVRQEFVEQCFVLISLRADEVDCLYQRINGLYGAEVRWEDD